MKYPKEYIDEIRSRLKVSSVVSKSVQLKKRGKEFVGLSPFKNEKTPSFTVNDEKGFFHCFSTGEHGNIFDFLMKTQNLKFGEAVKTLANMAGMRIYTFSKSDEIREKKFQTYTSIYIQYINHYHNYLIENESCKSIREYIKSRNLGINEVKKFKIGYVEKNPNFYEVLNKDYSEEDLKESGLFYFDEKKKVNIERFRDRIIFPINNISGKSIAIGGRTLNQTNYVAKYINSPETLFYKKGSNLYNLDVARKFSNIIENVYVVEGYMDVIALNKHKVENAVANLGTALTNKQIQILNQFFNHTIICFDGDNSGYKAALRAAENLIQELQPDKNISFLFLPEKEDPDTFINKNGKQSFIKYTDENLNSIYSFLFQHYKNETDGSPSSYAKFEKKLRLVANSIKDEFIKKYTMEFFLEKLNDLTPNLRNYSKNNFKKINKALNVTKRHFDETKSITQVELKEFSFLYLILNNPEIAKINLEQLQKVKLFTKESQIVLEQILKELDEIKDNENLSFNIDSTILERINKFASIKYILKSSKNDQNKIVDLMDEIIRDLKNYELERRIEELESKFSEDLSESTFNKIRELKKLQKVN
tara:strand:- start:936 stop:2711 length:1776 start_codon:yes stop_codon:yes gene_type:complete